MAETLQIDVLGQSADKLMMTCVLNTGERDVRIYMRESDYKLLIKEGFFIRSGEETDSAGVINTTRLYQSQTAQTN